MTVTTDTDRTASADRPADGPAEGPAPAELEEAREAAPESADSPDTADEPVADPTRRRSGRLLIAAAATVVVALAALAGVLGWQVWQQRQVDRAATAAQQAAVAYAQVLTSIDSAMVDDNFAQVLDGATGEFKDMYSESSTQLRQLLIDYKAAARGVVLESAVQSASTDEVVVLLFIDQTVSNSQVPDPRIDRSRVKMTMQHVDDKWRAAKVALP